MPLWFSPPVYVRTARTGIRYGVNNIEGAAEELVTWTKCGPKWRHAVEACLEGLRGRVSPDEVRSAFEEAAKEEGKFLPPVEA
ncbi:DUF982 domain-containing protein [Mesorhizobium sp. M00.F.Ca.ET.216.01.1.1]|uniref:DUF982 domain-containing protein n=1 Tax=Mesorhizobium sp. M00.F.Ca.ET.216.01.1.1 TaxID=2500528 RepID=UPI000FDC9024|nr:DUF982 domain-containing protein [Mesorhizobium sp. M00.F.Ca.ET.216.01.1.1]TGQ35835.1 DUF982 domain-containing protein [Mesorhizobium sp. M00.F.Ca.ET.216.01.1.1]TJW07000.1 MAG: DUF982 domain-containing protein [Mesorhizobium sp.]TJW42565.1 MAG: DUF982 domain-containing protein [Mesorhizobium sp.]